MSVLNSFLFYIIPKYSYYFVVNLLNNTNYFIYTEQNPLNVLG